MYYLKIVLMNYTLIFFYPNEATTILIFERLNKLNTSVNVDVDSFSLTIKHFLRSVIKILVNEN